MNAAAVIERQRVERGMSTAELSRRSNIEYHCLYKSLSGSRGLDANELLSLSKVLDLNLSDFEDEDDDAMKRGVPDAM